MHHGRLFAPQLSRISDGQGMIPNSRGMHVLVFVQRSMHDRASLLGKRVSTHHTVHVNASGRVSLHGMATFESNFENTRQNLGFEGTCAPEVTSISRAAYAYVTHAYQHFRHMRTRVHAHEACVCDGRHAHVDMHRQFRHVMHVIRLARAQLCIHYTCGDASDGAHMHDARMAPCAWLQLLGTYTERFDGIHPRSSARVEAHELIYIAVGMLLLHHCSSARVATQRFRHIQSSWCAQRTQH